MKVQGKVVETLVIEKVVEVEVPDDCAQSTIEEFLKAKAYEDEIFSDSDTHGWEGVQTNEVEVFISEAK